MFLDFLMVFLVFSRVFFVSFEIFVWFLLEIVKAGCFWGVAIGPLYRAFRRLTTWGFSSGRRM